MLQMHEVDGSTGCPDKRLVISYAGRHIPARALVMLRAKRSGASCQNITATPRDPAATAASIAYNYRVPASQAALVVEQATAFILERLPGSCRCSQPGGEA